MEPVLIQNVEKRHVAYDKSHHHPVFVSGGSEHRTEFAVDDPDVCELLNYGLQGVLQSAVVLTQNERIDPLPKYIIVQLFAQTVKCAFDVGRYRRRFALESHKDFSERRLDIPDILTNRLNDVVAAFVRGRDDRKRRFKLRLRLFLVVGQGACDIEERDQSEGHGKDRHQEQVVYQDRHDDTDREQNDGSADHNGELFGLARRSERPLYIHQNPVELVFLSVSANVLRLVSDRIVRRHQLHQVICDLFGRQAEEDGDGYDEKN